METKGQRETVPVLGVDLGSARLHVARVQRGRAVAVPAADGRVHIPSVVAWGRGRPLVGSAARAHLMVSPKEVLFGPARHLGGSAVKLGATSYRPEELVSWLLKEALGAGQAAAGAEIDGVALSRAAWASPEARQALDRAVVLAGVKPLGTEVSTTLAATAHAIERALTGTVAVVDAGAWKLEAAIVSLAPGQVRVLGRSVDATIGGSWLDGQVVRAMAHSVAPDHERQILKDRVCHGLLREQCENARINLSTLAAVDVSLPFLAPFTGVSGTPVGRLDRRLIESLARPLCEAIETVCREAAAQAGIEPTQVTDVILVGGLARMPAVRVQVAGLFGREPHKGGDIDGAVARGAALLAAAATGEIRIEILDTVEAPSDVAAGAGWGQPVPPPPLTPTPELIFTPPSPSPESVPSLAAHRAAGAEAEAVPGIVTDEPTAPNLTAGTAEVELPPDLRPTPATGYAPLREPPIVTPPPDLVGTAPAEHVPHKGPPSTRYPLDVPFHAHAPSSPPPPASHPDTPPVLAPERPMAPPASAPTLPSEGGFKNPRTAQGLAALSLGGTLNLQPPLPISVLLLAIGRRRHLNGTLKLTYKSTHTNIAVLRGGVGGSPLEMEQLRRSFEWPEGQYKITGDAPLHQNITRIPAVNVVIHGLRSALRSLNLGEVMKVIEPRLGDAPHVVQIRSPLIPLMGLSPRELRFVEHVMDGVTSASDILARGGIGKDTAIQILFVLQVFGALEWLPAERAGGETVADRLNARAAKLDPIDHFEALGVHWSVPRADIDRAFRSLQELLGPGGRGEQVAPEAAPKILARAAKAYEVLALEATRRAYLLEIHPDVDYEAIESLADNQAEWYSWRGVDEATRETRRLKNELIHLARMQHHEPKKD
jgi:Molecular chaperone